jgi:hypothetical protein
VIKISQVINEIKRQLVSQGVKLKGKTLVKIDNDTLRVHTPSKRIGDFDFTSVDIKYDKVKDLYDLSIHKGDKKTLNIKTCKVSGLFFDQLPDYFNKEFIKSVCIKKW